MEIDVFCRNDKCPICDSEINKISQSYWNCRNSCFAIDKLNSHVFLFRIFDEIFSLVNDNNYPNKEKHMLNIINKIKYWKENDRYLIKIMGGCN